MKQLLGLYSRQKCTKCAATLVYMPFLRGVFCPKHPKMKATSDFYVHFHGQRKSFAGFLEAENYLLELKRKVENGISLGVADNPFSRLSAAWLQEKKLEVGKSHYENLERYINMYSDKFGDYDVMDIKRKMIHEFLYSFNGRFSSKTLDHMRNCLKSLYRWMLINEIIDRLPFFDLPVIKIIENKRKIVDKSVQCDIIRHLKKISNDINPRIWVGVYMLAVYISVRPGALRLIRNGDIDFERGFLVLRAENCKEKKQREVPLVPDDLGLMRQYVVGGDDDYYFRHVVPRSGVAEGEIFGRKYLWKWWGKACSELGVTGVDLYGGTRHTSITALGLILSPEQVRGGSMHSTSKSFLKYFTRGSAVALDVYRASHFEI